MFVFHTRQIFLLRFISFSPCCFLTSWDVRRLNMADRLKRELQREAPPPCEACACQQGTITQNREWHFSHRTCQLHTEEQLLSKDVFSTRVIVVVYHLSYLSFVYCILLISKILRPVLPFPCILGAVNMDKAPTQMSVLVHKPSQPTGSSYLL